MTINGKTIKGEVQYSIETALADLVVLQERKKKEEKKNKKKEEEERLEKEQNFFNMLKLHQLKEGAKI